MKKLFIAVLFLFPTLAFAQTFDTNLQYGMTNNQAVTALQEFLTGQHVYNGPISGNFFSLTLAAVKRFQTAESITPVSGFVGPITRGTINSILDSQTTISEGSAATTTLPIDLSQATSTVAPPQVIYVQVPAPIVVPTPVQTITTPIVQTPAPRNPPTVTGNNVIADSKIVTSGIHEVTFGSFTLSVSNGDENPTLTSIPLTLTLSNGAQASDLKACQLFDGAGYLLNGGMIVYGAGVQTMIDGGHGTTVPFALHDRLTLPVNSSSTFTVVCWIASTAVPGASYAWSLGSNSTDWNISGAQWSDIIPINILGGQGTTVTVSSTQN